jgi:hypothetical protein
MELYYVEWCDAITSFDGWSDKDSIKEWGEKEEWIIKQAGYILEDNKEYLLIASKYNPQESDKDRFSEITKIPKTWLRKKIVITSLVS